MRKPASLVTALFVLLFAAPTEAQQASLYDAELSGLSLAGSDSAIAFCGVETAG